MRKTLAVLALLVFPVAAQAASEIFVSDHLRLARGLRVRFSEPVRIVAFGDVFTTVSPTGAADEFVFYGGELERYGMHWLSWEPASASLIEYRWLQSRPEPYPEPLPPRETTPPDEYLQLGEEALMGGHLLDALELFLAAAEGFAELGDLERQAEALSNAAVCYHERMEFEASAALLLEALELVRRSETGEGENWILHNLACSYRERGQYGEALEYFQASLSVSREIANPVAEAHSLTSQSYLYYLLGEFETALALNREALRLFDSDVDAPQGKAHALHHQAVYLNVLGEAEVALDYARQSLDLRKEIGDHLYEDNALGLLGSICMSLGRWEEAVSYLEEELRLATASGKVSGAFNALLFLGLVEEAQSRPHEAIAYLDEAIDLAEGSSLLDRRWCAYYNVAVCHWRLGNGYETLRWLERAIEDIERIRRLVELEELRSTFFQSTRSVYEFYIRVLLHSGRDAETLSVAERCRARGFLDLLALGPADLSDDVTESGIRSGVIDASQIESDSAEVIASLPEDSVALEYFVTGSVTYLWVIRDGEPTGPFQIEVTRRSLLDLVLGFRRALESPPSHLTDLPEADLLAKSRDLYDLLIGPIEERLSGATHLVIVPSGPLYYLPFAALFDSPSSEPSEMLFEGEYLIEQFALSYTPSLAILNYALESEGNPQPHPSFLALADPVTEDPGLIRLPEAQREAEAASRLFASSETYFGADATEAVIRERAVSADHVLLSTHAMFNPRNPMFSYLSFSVTPDSDGRLHTHEVFSLELDADLVTLSACETLLPALKDAESEVRTVRALSEQETVQLDETQLESLTAGDEIVGLTRAFIYAGTQAVMSSLWKVVSIPTEGLMVSFYGYLAAGCSKADALRQAQLDLISSYPNPLYWAAFSIVGSWS